MGTFFRQSTVPVILAALAVPAWAGLAAQSAPADSITVSGSVPADLTGLEDGPDVEGVISARTGQQVQITGADGSRTPILVSDATKIRATKGLFGLDRTALDAGS